MAEITTKFDPTVEIEEIKMALYTATPEEEPENAELGEFQQTKVEGIAAPLVRLNDISIISDQVVKFELHSNPLPSVDIEINDRWNLSKVLDSPKSDNLLVVQIIPPFDNGYKKINLRFYITEYRTRGRNIVVHGVYNIPEQQNIVLEAFGEKTTYELAELIAQRLKLGLASNLDGTDDKRWMYCPSKILFDVLEKEVPFGGADTQLLDWWVDYWNYLNLVDLYDRYTNNEDNLKIWTMTTAAVELNEQNSTDPVEVDAVLTNHPSMNGTPLHIDKYDMHSSTSENLLFGTDKTIETYSMEDLNSETTDVMDGDVHNDIFKKYEYGGEIFGEHNYLVQKVLQESFLQKMKSQYIDIELVKPQLGLVRGGRVNLNWYECNEFVNRAMEEENESMSTNSSDIDTTDKNAETEDENGNAVTDDWVLNKTISGQYYILDSWFKYDKMGGGMNWHHYLRLCRPADMVQTYLEGLNEDGGQQS